MPQSKSDLDDFDWSVTTWEGSRRAQLKVWASLSLREIIQAQEEMRELHERFARMRSEELGTAESTKKA